MTAVKPTKRQTPDCPTCGKPMRFCATGRAPWKAGATPGVWRFSFYCGAPRGLSRKVRRFRVLNLKERNHDRVDSHVPMSKSQVRRYKISCRQMYKDAGDLHKVAHAFQRAIKWGAWEEANRLAGYLTATAATSTTRERKDRARQKRLDGARKELVLAQRESSYPDIRALLARAEQAAKKNRKILVVGVDDDHHCSSDVVLVPHESRKRFMGTSVYHFPQCGGIPTRFFLYPGHVDGLVKALRVVQKRARRKRGACSGSKTKGPG